MATAQQSPDRLTSTGTTNQKHLYANNICEHLNLYYFALMVE